METTPLCPLEEGNYLHDDDSKRNISKDINKITSSRIFKDLPIFTADTIKVGRYRPNQVICLDVLMNTGMVRASY